MKLNDKLLVRNIFKIIICYSIQINYRDLKLELNSSNKKTNLCYFFSIFPQKNLPGVQVPTGNARRVPRAADLGPGAARLQAWHQHEPGGPAPDGLHLGPAGDTHVGEGLLKILFWVSEFFLTVVFFLDPTILWRNSIGESSKDWHPGRTVSGQTVGVPTAQAGPGVGLLQTRGGSEPEFVRGLCGREERNRAGYRLGITWNRLHCKIPNRYFVLGYVKDAPAPTGCSGCGEGLAQGEMAVTAPKFRDQILWHPRCFRCTTCDELLVDLTYCVHDDQIYCERHYAELLKPRCNSCDEVSGGDLVWGAFEEKRFFFCLSIFLTKWEITFWNVGKIIKKFWTQWALIANRMDM